MIDKLIILFCDPLCKANEFKCKKRKEKMKKSSSPMKTKMKKVMEEFSGGKLHSGSKKGPVVHNRKQAVAIGLSEARKAGAKIPTKKKGK